MGDAQTDVAIVAERQRMMEEWKEWYSTKEDWMAWHAAGLAQLLGPRLQEGDFTLEEVETEQVSHWFFPFLRFLYYGCLRFCFANLLYSYLFVHIFSVSFELCISIQPPVADEDACPHLSGHLPAV